MRNSFEVLGVAETATDAEIKSAFRKLAMDCHPDRHQGDKKKEEKFKEINEAYQNIGTSDNRLKYKNEQRFANMGPRGFHSNSFNFGGDEGIDGINDFINQFFSQGGFSGRPQPQQRRNRDINITIEVSLETLHKGTEIPVVFTHNNQPVNLSVKLPYGIEHGTRMRFQGHGDNTNQGLPPGDLYATIKINRHPIFSREQQHLLADITVDAIDAIVGAKLPFVCLDGKTETISVPAGTQHDSIIRVVNKGLPTSATSFGDLFLKISISIPKNVTSEQKKQLKKIFA